MTTHARKELAKFWHEATTLQRGYVDAVNSLQARYNKARKPKDRVRIVWLDELMIGVEVRHGRKPLLLYDTDIATED